ncbi:SpoIID/LytB domain-containing protein [Fervidobacterium sp.]
MKRMRIFLLMFAIVLQVTLFSLNFPTRISVLLSVELDASGGSKGYLFTSAKFECMTPVSFENETFEAGSVLEITTNQESLVVNGNDTGKNTLVFKGNVKLISAKRAIGVPQYTDTIIIKVVNGKIAIINELDVEKYVELVVPSEVPAWFAKEAIKAQAVLARSRAVADVLSGPKDKFYGAHCDDSTNSQVFNNQVVSDIVKVAVSETTGEILIIDDKPLSTIVYFSTSAGFTSNNEEVWSDSKGNFPGEPIPYLRSKPQFGNLIVDKVDETFWHKFFKSFWGDEKELCDFYDRESPWFRWKVTMTREELEVSISKGLIAREKADLALGFDAVRTVEGKMIDVNDPNFSIGELKDLQVLSRGQGGVIMTLRIIAENGIYDVDKEYNIRFVIRPTRSITGTPRDINIERHDGSIVPNYSILPSAYFTYIIDKAEDGRVKQITFYGGGNGHGVGMSQYGAHYLAKNGKSYQEIIHAFYEGEIKKVF